MIESGTNQDMKNEDILRREDDALRKKKGQFNEIWERFIRNKLSVISLCIIGLLVIGAIFADQLAPYGPDDQNLSQKLLLPCKEYPFGTDDYGRDILSRIIYGSRPSLIAGAISVTFSCIVGTFIGCIAGFYGSRVENILMRIIDVLQAIPSTLLAISIAAALGPGLENAILAVAISSIPGYSRLMRGSILSLKEQEFIEAARSVGASDLRIIFRHILPNCMAPIIVQATMSIATAIISVAGLSFVGLGITPPTPEWGSMLSAGRPYIRQYWHVVTFPGLMIMVTVFSLNILGDGLRDALDPKLKK